ncbi:hypothetical protein FQR65_LT13526 [Abscondita terminalis]|nr:hypothetical protein FQR65_LT13526 [Abscondita terminalis]
MDAFNWVSVFISFIMRFFVNVLHFVINFVRNGGTVNDNVKISGGGRKKATFNWCEISEYLLLESYAAVLENNEKPIKKRLMTRFIQNLNEHQINYVKSSISEASLMSHLNLLKKEKKPDNRNLKWDAEMEKILVECGIEVTLRQNLFALTKQKTLGFAKLLHESFTERIKATDEKEILDEIENLTLSSEVMEVKSLKRTAVTEPSTSKIAKIVEENVDRTNRDDLPSKCEEVLKEMIENKIYASDCVALRRYLSEKRELCDAVDELLLSAARVTTADVNITNLKLYDLGKFKQVPQSMRKTYKGATIRGDGNCWYSSLSVGLFGTPEYWTVIRFASVRAMVKYDRYFRRYAEDFYMPDRRDPPLEERDRFLFGLLNAGTVSDKIYLTESKYGDQIIFQRQHIQFSWADNVTQLASQISIGRPIAIYSDIMLGSWTSHTRNLNDSEPLFVLHQTNHFETMIPVTRNETFEKPLAPNLMFLHGPVYVDEYVE